MKDEDKVITHEWLVSKSACYFDACSGYPCTVLGAWLMPKLPISIEQLGRMRKIPSDDKLWALCRLMSEEQRSLAARRSALRCIGNWEAEVPEVVLRWLREGREQDRGDAYSAATSAAYSAAYSAMWHAARSAAGSAAGSTAEYAWSAARSAAYSDMWNAARSAAEYASTSAAYSAAYSAMWHVAGAALVKDAIAILRGSVTKATQ